MIQFHCTKCKRTWKKEENKPNITYRDGTCGDCFENEMGENSNNKLIQSKQNLLLKPKEIPFDDWYSWFISVLGRKPNDTEKNAIRDLLKAQLAKSQEVCLENKGLNITEATKRACEEPTLLDALSWICIWESVRVVEQARRNAQWETCFKVCLRSVLDNYLAQEVCPKCHGKYEASKRGS